MPTMRLLITGIGDAFTARSFGTSAVIAAPGGQVMIDCPDPVHRVLREGGAEGRVLRVLRWREGKGTVPRGVARRPLPQARAAPLRHQLRPRALHQQYGTPCATPQDPRLEQARANTHRVG